MNLPKFTNNLHIFQSKESHFHVLFLQVLCLTVIFFDVFFDVCFFMAIFSASSHTYFRHDHKIIRRCDKFKANLWYKIKKLSLNSFSCSFFLSFTKLFALEFSVSKKKPFKNIWLDVWGRYLLIIVCATK